jgi:hypothetical protein
MDVVAGHEGDELLVRERLGTTVVTVHGISFSAFAHDDKAASAVQLRTALAAIITDTGETHERGAQDP